jgi:hypothetical protein
VSDVVRLPELLRDQSQTLFRRGIAPARPELRAAIEREEIKAALLGEGPEEHLRNALMLVGSLGYLLRRDARYCLCNHPEGAHATAGTLGTMCTECRCDRFEHDPLYEPPDTLECLQAIERRLGRVLDQLRNGGAR